MAPKFTILTKNLTTQNVKPKQDQITTSISIIFDQFILKTMCLHFNAQRKCSTSVQEIRFIWFVTFLHNEIIMKLYIAISTCPTITQETVFDLVVRPCNTFKTLAARQ